MTVKDVLRHEAVLEHEQDASANAWEERRWEERVGLEGVLEEAWTWATGLFSCGVRAGSISNRLVPLTPTMPDTPGRGSEQHAAAFSYELDDRVGAAHMDLPRVAPGVGTRAVPQ